jgi:hypothetical protein
VEILAGGKSTFRGVLASAPSGPQEGWTYINSGDNGYYIYYGGSWQSLHTLTPEAVEYLLMEDGGSLLQENGDKLALD